MPVNSGSTTGGVTLGTALRKKRLALGLRQRDVAELLGTVQAIYSRWEQDASKPANIPALAPRLAAFLGVDVDDAIDLLVDRSSASSTEMLRAEVAELRRAVDALQVQVDRQLQAQVDRQQPASEA
jgi:transcriptional regulator with XRE-family HTH domain